MLLGRKTWLIDPCAPINLSEDLVHHGGVIILVSNVGLPGRSELSGLNGGLLVGEDVGSEELLEVVLADQALEECEELEAFFVGNCRESSIRGVTLSGRVE